MLGGRDVMKGRLVFVRSGVPFPSGSHHCARYYCFLLMFHMKAAPREAQHHQEEAACRES